MSGLRNVPHRFDIAKVTTVVTQTRPTTTSTTWTTVSESRTWEITRYRGRIDVLDVETAKTTGWTFQQVSVRCPKGPVVPASTSTATTTYPEGQTASTALTRFQTTTKVYTRVRTPKPLAGVLYGEPKEIRANVGHFHFYIVSDLNAAALLSVVPDESGPDRTN